jgi:ribosomal protein L15
LKKTSDNHKIIKAYGKSLPEDEIRSIIGRAIPPELTVNLLALVKEPWIFKDLEDQLNMYRQQWQAYQQNKIIAKMANGGRSSTRQGNTSRGGRGGRGRGRGGRGGRGNTSDHLKNVECFNCGKKGHYSTECSLPRKNDNEQSNMVSKADFKKLFQSSLKEMLTKNDKQAKKKESTEGDDYSLDMNVFKKLMEGKHTKIVNKSNDDLQSINDTDTFDYSMQDKITHKSCGDNN